MGKRTSTQAIARLGPYELDVRSGEVRKFGIRVKLGEQPLRILILLTERAGELVTREELRDRLWSHEEAVLELEQKFLVDGDRTAADALTHAFQDRGSQAVAEWRWQNTKKGAPHGYASPWWLALDYARARHEEETLKLLEDAYRRHSPRLIFLQNEPLFDFLHSDPRYQSLARKLPVPPSF